MRVRDTTPVNPLKLPEVRLPDVKDETGYNTANDYRVQDGAEGVQVS